MALTQGLDGGREALERAACTFRCLARDVHDDDRERGDLTLQRVACLALLGRADDALDAATWDGLPGRLEPDLLTILGTLCPSLARDCLPRVTHSGMAAHLRLMEDHGGTTRVDASAESFRSLLPSFDGFAMALALVAQDACEGRRLVSDPPSADV